ncbi:MAG: hypothetical protein IKA86_02820, partial [Paraprevotella sp.]|nr:hypothetical protein [Paraprevotella sp.]
TTRNYMNQDDSNGQGWGADSWSIDFDQDVTLPSGEYVFKVAGRRSGGTTLRLIASVGETTLGTVEDFPASNNARGIDKAGETSFDPEDEDGFANNGNGYGWQWRYVKFTLNEESTVKIAVHAEASSKYQWVSFGDYTLQMTEETYMEANQSGLDAALAPAQALVNTKPMGTAENTALSNAINMPVTTGAEMKAKIDALNTAVTNANTWRTAYNDAKAPLVVQLDRFEANFNDAENGCVSQLYTEIWNTCIEKVAAAAEAKDITDSYDQFEIITEELTAANDAVEASIAVYKNLKAEIGYANAYTLVVESNQTGYTEAINTAQAIWDGGTKEDPSAEILAMQNFKVLDYNYVTETYEGVATLGDWGGNSESTNKGEHWDGTAESSYYDYSRWSGNAGNFEVTQEYNLPAGTYVLMAAGRCANVDGTDAYIKVKEEKVYFNKKGGSGLGISTDGKASFNPTGTYANTTGRGWEYRFIEFTLNSEETVTIGLGYTVADSYNPLSWAGVCAPQLRAKKFTMTDKADIENETKEGYMVSYDREFTAGTWTTVIVPFDYELPGGVTAEKLNFIAFNGPDNNWISFEKVTTLAANTPYILKNNSGTDALFADLGIKTVYSTASTNSVGVDGATMKGTYKEISAKDLVAQEGGDKDIIFINTNGEGRYIDNAQPAAITFPAGRAYIVVDGSTFDIANNVAPRFTIFHGDDDITSIEETLNQKNEEEVIYDLAGRRIVKPTKAGIYIVNGKKMVIK